MMRFVSFWKTAKNNNFNHDEDVVDASVKIEADIVVIIGQISSYLFYIYYFLFILFYYYFLYFHSFAIIRFSFSTSFVVIIKFFLNFDIHPSNHLTIHQFLIYFFTYFSHLW